MEMEEEGNAEMKDSKKFKGMNGKRRREEETFFKMGWAWLVGMQQMSFLMFRCQKKKKESRENYMYV